MAPSLASKRPTYADIEALPPHVIGEILGGELVVSPRPAAPQAKASSALGGGLDGFNFDSDGPGGWTILDEPELRLDVDPDYPVVVPDLAGWRVERMPVVPDEATLRLAPDWVCEVLSPSTQVDDRVYKELVAVTDAEARAPASRRSPSAPGLTDRAVAELRRPRKGSRKPASGRRGRPQPAGVTATCSWVPFYARAGVAHLWLVDPLAFTLEVYRREGANWVLLGVHAHDAVVRAEPFEAAALALVRLWGGRRPPPRPGTMGP